jgi:periplasmic protein TonB
MSWLFPKYYGGAQQQKEGVAGLGASIMIHGVILVAAAYGFSHSEQIEELARPIAVSLMEATQPKPEKPVPPPPKVKTPPLLQPAPVATTVATTPSNAPSGVMAPAPVAVATPAAEGPVTEARFDADYLSNPKPPYPSASRRLGETGTVYLRVQVSGEGQALQVELKKSSGFTRLDQSAQETVARWKFVPAKKGNNPVTSWVVVPIVFSLT